MCVCARFAISNRMVGGDLIEKGTLDLKEAGFSCGAPGRGVLGPSQSPKASDTQIPAFLQVLLRTPTCRLVAETNIPPQQN